MTRPPGRPTASDSSAHASERIQVKMTPAEKALLDETVCNELSSISQEVRRALKQDRALRKFRSDDGALEIIDPVTSERIKIYI